MIEQYKMPPERPDWVHCIERTHEQHKGFAWCGVYVRGYFSFVSLDHAAENGIQEGRLVACKQCVEAAVKALHNGHDDSDYQE